MRMMSIAFKIGGIYDYNGGLCIFMPQEDLNQTFDLGDDYFSGYFSNSEITDIDSRYIGSVIDLDALTKISRQLNVSMGSMMGLVNGFAIAIYMILIYLLSKIIIEKNAQSISMTKILGYTNGEISRLYIMSTSICSNPLSPYQPADRGSGHESTVPGSDAAEYFRMDCSVDRSDDLCEDVWGWICNLCRSSTSGISQDT